MPIEERASSKIRSVIADIKAHGYSSVSPFSIGKVEKEMKEYAKNNGIILGSDEIVMSVKQITHTLRETKEATGKSVGGKDLAEFPTRRAGMELYHDNSNGNFVYFDRSRNEKFVIHPNYKMKIKIGKKKETHQKVNYITASRTNAQEFTLAKFIKIK